MSDANNSDKMNSYLIQWRTSVWISMREKESNCWKFIAVYVPAVIAILGVGSQYFPPFVSVLACLFATAWGLLTVVDANYWFNRNLKIVSNIEKYIAPYVYEQRLIPSNYAEPRFSYLMTYRTMIRLFTIVFLSVLLWYAHIKKSDGTYQTWALIYFVTVAICLWVLLEDNGRRNEYVTFSSAATGSNKIEDSPKRLNQAMKAICKFDTRGPVIHFVTANLQMVFLLLFFGFIFPDAKGSLWYTILLSWPFVYLFIGITPKLESQKMQVFSETLMSLLRFIFVISFTVIATSAGFAILILKAITD